MKIAIDFDGTVVDHDYPDVGKDAPDAEVALNWLVSQGHQLILYTMRSGKELDDAIQWYKNKNIPLFGVQKDPEQGRWTTSNKCYANVYIDDAALGAPLVKVAGFNRMCIDWTEALKYFRVSYG